MKTVLITGASSGIGKATAIYLAQAGYQVYGAARRKTLLDELKPYGIIPLEMDLSKDESICLAIAQIQQESQSIDILINNAGSGYYGALEDMSLEDARYQMEINVFSAARLIQLVLPAMRKNQYGKIINISSVGGKITLPMGSWYHASKFALEGLSDALRKELKAFGIDVILIEPGGTKSEMTSLGTEYLNKTSGHTSYSNLAKGVSKLYAKTTEGASDPIVIAKIIKKAIEAKCPKTRYVGASGAKLMLALHKFTTDRSFDKLILNQLK